MEEKKGKAKIEAEEKEPVKRHFTGVLVLNWEDSTMKVLKRDPNKIAPYEIAIDLDVCVTVPRMKKYTVKGEVEIPEVKVKEIFVESL